MVGVRRPRVVVVGAGLAGLRCGEVLHSSGHFDVVVLEGASRIGGRAWTVGRLDGAEGLMEAGATYIHGAEGNPLVRISAQRSGSPRPPGRRRVCYGDGRRSRAADAGWAWASGALAACDDAAPEEPATASVGGERGDIAFEPPLPPERAAALGAVAFGVVNKVALSWETPWWRDVGDQRGDWDVVWRDEDRVPGAWLPGVCQWRHAATLTGPPTLVGWCAGETANAALEALDDEAVRFSAAFHVATVAGLRGKERDAVAAGARLALRTSWGAAPSFGSYSYVRTGRGGADLDAVAAPLGRVRFAGEHTHRSRYSTADGALLSGDREAFRLLATVDAPFSCAVVRRADGSFLAEARGPDARAAPDKLTCYGGKREAGESSAACLLRELDEELRWAPAAAPDGPAASLVVNGLLVAHFYAVARDDDADFVLEPGRGQLWAARDDPRWSKWHKVVLDAIVAGEHLAYFDDGDRGATLAMLRKLPTAAEMEAAHAAAAAVEEPGSAPLPPSPSPTMSSEALHAHVLEHRDVCARVLEAGGCGRCALRYTAPPFSLYELSAAVVGRALAAACGAGQRGETCRLCLGALDAATAEAVAAAGAGHAGVGDRSAPGVAEPRLGPVEFSLKFEGDAAAEIGALPARVRPALPRRPRLKFHEARKRAARAARRRGGVPQSQVEAALDALDGDELLALGDWFAAAPPPEQCRPAAACARADAFRLPLPEAELSAMPQSPWVVDGVVKGTASVEEVVAAAARDVADCDGETKTKTYACVVWCARDLTARDVATCDRRDFDVAQKTPVRVMHSRSLAVREKRVHELSLRRLNGRFAVLTIVTSAGMYIKEFVHGDLGRTEPSLASMLGARADILQLDVLDVEDAGLDP
ncbi:peroxisomal N(1)-acetyl-spermine spermidine oxidase [Aureococcus anophagefferens]|uniref:Peroxisomal N(1)-acetyl-spermine spermidine oxidase n=1 Tax=Aureococcus anophagefferens TaxID=44056 RepID=A0ABR1FSU8_AURAN